MSVMPGTAKDAVQHHRQEHQVVNQSGHENIFSNEETSIRMDRRTYGNRSRVAQNCLGTLTRVPDLRFWHPFRMRGTEPSLPAMQLSTTTG